TAGAGATQIDANTVEVPLSSVKGKLVLDLLDGDDTVTLDYTGGDPLPAAGIDYRGGAGFDSLSLLGGPATHVKYSYTNDTDGSVPVDGKTITYTGLDPITDTLAAGNRTFTFTGGAETVTVSDSGGADGLTRIDSSLGEFVDFAAPSSSLTIVTNG